MMTRRRIKATTAPTSGTDGEVIIRSKDQKKSTPRHSRSKHKRRSLKDGRQNKRLSGSSEMSYDVMMLSQTGASEVIWNNDMPNIDAASGDTDTIDELVQKFAADSDETNDVRPSTPPLESLWMDSPTNSEHLSKRIRRQPIRKLKRLDKKKCNKSVIDSTNILNKLSAVLQQEKNKKFTPPKSLKLEESEKIFCSTQKPEGPYKSSPLEKVCLSPILQKTQKKVMNILDTPKSALKAIPSRSSNACTPTARNNGSIDDLWTDEELFENDSFLVATQAIICGEKKATPSPQFKVNKRRISTPIGGIGKKRQTSKLDNSPMTVTCHNISDSDSSSDISAVFKKPEQVTPKSKLQNKNLLSNASKKTVNTNERSQNTVNNPNPCEQPMKEKLSSFGPLKDSSVDTTVTRSTNVFSKDKNNLNALSLNKMHTMSNSKVGGHTVVSSNSNVSSTVRNSISNPPVYTNSSHKTIASKNGSKIAGKSPSSSCAKVNSESEIPNSERMSIRNNNSFGMNVSISEDLLATLAEPDEIWDSQVPLFDETMSIPDTVPEKAKSNNNFVGVISNLHAEGDKAIKDKPGEWSNKDKLETLYSSTNSKNEIHVHGKSATDRSSENANATAKKFTFTSNVKKNTAMQQPSKNNCPVTENLQKVSNVAKTLDLKNRQNQIDDNLKKTGNINNSHKPSKENLTPVYSVEARKTLQQVKPQLNGAIMNKTNQNPNKFTSPVRNDVSILSNMSMVSDISTLKPLAMSTQVKVETTVNAINGKTFRFKSSQAPVAERQNVLSVKNVTKTEPNRLNVHKSDVEQNKKCEKTPPIAVSSGSSTVTLSNRSFDKEMESDDDDDFLALLEEAESQAQPKGSKDKEKKPVQQTLQCAENYTTIKPTKNTNSNNKSSALKSTNKPPNGHAVCLTDDNVHTTRPVSSAYESNKINSISSANSDNKSQSTLQSVGHLHSTTRSSATTTKSLPQSPKTNRVTSQLNSFAKPNPNILHTANQKCSPQNITSNLPAGEGLQFKTNSKDRKLAPSGLGNSSSRSLQKFPSHDCLNPFASPKAVDPYPLSASQDSKRNTSVCDQREIEKKKQEALKRRQNRLKLKVKK